jgi:hypothetical protein
VLDVGVAVRVTSASIEVTMASSGTLGLKPKNVISSETNSGAVDCAVKPPPAEQSLLHEAKKKINNF